MTVSDAHRAQLTAAVTALQEAVQTHLDAVLQRTGEADREVQAAYTRLRAASAQYEDLLFDLTDEVVPWQAPDGPDLDEDDGDATSASAVSVLLRRDYDLVDDDALLAAGRAAYTHTHPDEAAEAAGVEVVHAGHALSRLLDAYGVDGLDSRAERSGLDPLGGTLWVQALTDDDLDTLDDEPFGIADDELLVYRLDEVSPD